MNDRWSAAWCLSLAALLLGFAIQLNLGRLSDGAVLLVTGAVCLTAFGVCRPKWDSIGERNVRYAIGMTLIIQLGLLFVWPPTTADALQSASALFPFRLGLIAALPLVLLELTEVKALRRTRAGALFGLWAAAAVWVIAASPAPTNDVWWFQQIGGDALLHRTSPYAVQMPNLYGPGSPVYAPETMVGDHLTFGLPYPPISLFLTLPGYALFGDVRYALLAAVLIAGWFMRDSRPGPVARGAAMLFLFTPRSLFVVAQAWTEPLLVLLLAFATWAAIRQLRVLPIALGLLVGVKQHLVLVLPMAIGVLPWPKGRNGVIRGGTVALTVAVALTFPFVVWDPAGFWRSLILLQIQQPFRPDALSYPAWLHLDDPIVSSVLGFLAIVPAATLAAWRAARTPAGFAATVAIVYLLFFAFNKQAFANYYYFVIGALACAVAATATPDARASDRT